jgi:DNA-directed RNA polymerase specialized sigma24 family protein
VGRLAVEKGMTEEPFGTDEALVEGLKAGEQLAQLILVKRYGPRVKYLIKSISWDLAEEDAKEVASDVFRRVIRGVRGFDPARGAFGAWLYRIAANATRDHVRKSKTLQARFGRRRWLHTLIRTSSVTS